MSSLPDIIREPRIVSGKVPREATIIVDPQLTHSAHSLDQYDTSNNNTNSNGSNSAAPVAAILKKEHPPVDSPMRHESSRARRKRDKSSLYVKRNPSGGGGVGDSSELGRRGGCLQATSVTNFYDEDEILRQQKLPSLVFNDGQRSLAYTRVIRSSDFVNVRNAPIATRLIYNWEPAKRNTTKMATSKVKLFKPKKRIEMPARAPSPYKIQWGWETSEASFHNEKRALEMKSLRYMQDHAKWSVYPYAAVDEKEEYK
jgi:hypothetical protein